MNTIDNRIIHMKFDNIKFERDIHQSIKSINELKTAMDFSNISKNFSKITEATKLNMTVNTSQFETKMAEAFGTVRKIQDNLNFGATAESNFARLAEGLNKNFNPITMANGVAGISKKFLALATIGVTALAQIASQAARTGIDMATSLTTDPIIDGFREMETNMNSIQTILANTASKGTTLDDVNTALAQLNEYSDRTIYNFSQMAKNIGTFTAAGIDLDTSVGAIKGIANLAAISGSNSEQASSAMYQLSQALAKGRVELIDWISVRNAGMGGEVFKSALFETLKALGKIEEVPMKTTFQDWTKAGNSFEDLLQRDVITAEVLTTTLQAFTGDLTQAQLVSLGYTEDQAVEMEKLGKLGNAAATEVKTLTQLLGTVKESIGSGWAQSFQIIFGNFEEAKKMFTDFNGIISRSVAASANARNNLLEDWKKLGGRTRLIEGVTAAFQSLQHGLQTIGAAFHVVFPAVTGRRLFELTDRFAEFFENVRSNQRFFDTLNNSFRAAFEIFDIGIEIVKEIGEMFGDLFRHFTGGGGGDKAVDLINNIADGIHDLHEALIGDGGLDQFFDNLTERIINFVDAFRKDPSGKIKEIAGNLGSVIRQLFGVLVFGDFTGGFLAEDSPIVGFVFEIRDKLKEALESLKPIVESIEGFINGVLGTEFDFKIPDSIKNLFDTFKQNVDDNTTNSLAGGFERVKGYVENIRDGLEKAKDAAGEIWDVVKKMGDAFEWIWDTGATVFDTVRDVLGEIWEFTQNIGPTLQDAFMSDEFDRFLDLLDSIGVLLGGRGLQQFGRNNANLGANFGANIGSGLKPFAAFERTGGLIEQLEQNMGVLTETLKTMQTQIKANALLDIAKALALLTGSVLVLSFINPESLAKSLTALAVGMGQLLGAVALLNFSGGKAGLTPGFGMLGTAAAMNAIAVAILILSGALSVLAQLDPTDLANGLLTIETLIIELATMSALLKGAAPNLLVGGLGMIAIATSLVILAGALKIFATMSWEEIGKGIVTLTGVLLLLSASMGELTLKSAITGPAMVAVATSLVIIGAALKIFATMSWEEIGKGMTVLTGSLLILSAAMSSMPALSAITGPALIAVATALVILGGAMKIFASMGWEEIGRAMVVLTGSLLILSAALESMKTGLPGALALGVTAASLIVLGLALKQFAKMSWKEVGKGLLIMASSIVALALSASLVQPFLPAMLGLAGALALLGIGFAAIGVGAYLLAEAFQVMAAAGTAGIDVFMYAIDQFLVRVPELIKIFTDGMLLIVQSIIDALPAMITGFSKIIGALLQLLIDNIPEGARVVYEFIKAMLEVIRKSSPDFARTGFALLMDFLHALEDNITEITNTVATIIERFLRELGRHTPELTDAAGDLIVAFIEGLARQNYKIVAAGVEIFVKLLEGITDNLDDIAGAVGDLIEEFIKQVALLHWRLVDAGFDAFIEFLSGFGEDAEEIARVVGTMVTNIMDAIADEFVAAVGRAAKIVIDFLHDLADVIRENDDALSDAFADLGAAIIEGIIVGLVASAPKLITKIGEVMGDAIEEAGKFWEWGSPSQLMIRLGNDIIGGLIIGLDQRSRDLNQAIGGINEEAMLKFQSALDETARGLESSSEFNPSITPVLDLSQVQATAGQINGLLGTRGIVADVSLTQANALSAAAQAREEAATEVATEPQVRDISVTQINNSPTQLNTAKVYKQTRSLIQVTREELEKV